MTNRMRFPRLLSILFCGLLFLPLVLPASVAAQQTVREVRIEGAQRIDPVTIRTYMNFNEGDVIDQERANQMLKDLFATGLFADIDVRAEGGVLAVTVEENPILNQIAFEGNRRIEDEELQAEINLRSRQVFSRTRVQEAVARINQVYRRQGRFSAMVEPKIIELDQNRVDLVFEISEGEITKVRSIRFVGNERFSDDALRSEISTKESRWYRFITADDRYDPDRVAFDQEMLRRFYLNNGYADFRVTAVNAELSPNQRDFFLTYVLEEGERYQFGDIRIDSRLQNFDASVLQPEITASQGDWYSAEALRQSTENITNKLGDLQYAFVSIRPQTRKNRDARTIDIDLVINETPRVFVERVDIQGNVRTLDKVIRREFELVEGDPFNRSKLAQSEQNVRDLGYFESVEIETRRGSAPDKTIVDVDVSERSTGELSVGAGFSTNDGPLADLRIRERNFLGRGQDVLLAATVAGERTEFDFSFTEPYFLNRDLSAGVDLFHITRDLQDESSFDQQRTGGSVRFGYPLSENWRQTLRYRIEDNTIEDVQDDASLFVREQEGSRMTSAVSQRLTYENLDSTLFPTDGFNAWLDTEFAGIGGDANYVSAKIGGSYYYPVYLDKVVFNLLGEVGAIHGIGDENVVINERFFLGGQTLRGFERAGVGPRDLDTQDSLGGELFYRTSAELSFPVGIPEEFGVKGHAFTDAGSLWSIDEDSASSVNFTDEHEIRLSAGVGMSWRSPFGPIRLDFGFPLLSEEFDEEENFRFNFGTRF